MLEKYEVCCSLFHGFDWSRWVTGSPEERLSLLTSAQEHILAQEDGKDRLVRAVHELSQAFALAVPHKEALGVRDDVMRIAAAAISHNRSRSLGCGRARAAVPRPCRPRPAAAGTGRTPVVPGSREPRGSDESPQHRPRQVRRVWSAPVMRSTGPRLSSAQAHAWA